ncbi:MAG: alanine--tRNA ligase [Chloroflexi bacterium]|nr:alanine--tRNA ligase [Chloroflexota bacterium]
MPPPTTAAEIRQSFIDFFVKKKHTFVPSSSLVPGGDSTLLFTNAGMVQFKDIFLGTEKRGYNRAVNSQKCMRVAGKHNDLEDVGFNDTHHTFFEMLGNWSFGDYYKKEAIAWAWELLTEQWELPKDRMYVTVFKDELGEIPTDDEAVKYWKQQSGLNHEHILYFGRKDNFWEMANTGPCGPNSEIHFDLGPDHGELEYTKSGRVDLDGSRFVELWNLVFIQFNRTDPKTLDPLPSMHVDTGLGLDRIVSVLQNKDSNYRTDMFSPIIDEIQTLSKHTDKQRDENFSPYRVIADHARAAAFLIADGVVPGNIGRNYVTRMIIRRAARFGSKIGLEEPFLAKVAEKVIDNYGMAYPELVENQEAIVENLIREEERFQRTVEGGISQLESLLEEVQAQGEQSLDGAKAFDLYATHGLPYEITRDIAQEYGLDVEEDGFRQAMDAHRLASGAGQAMGSLGGEDVEKYQELIKDLQSHNKLPPEGVTYDPYDRVEVEGEILVILHEGEPVKSAKSGDTIELMLPETCFYVEAGGQVSDTGKLISAGKPQWEIRIDSTRQPAAGVITHIGEVIKGKPKVGDIVLASVDSQLRRDIMRNHTATHLLHAELHAIIGKHARQAGSLVAPDRLRFDFTHSGALSSDELSKLEEGVNGRILENHKLNIEQKSLEQARQDGAMALFGEKYGETVRTVSIGGSEPFSYELCGGTHVEQTGDIGAFLIVSEGSAAAGIRRLEAVTGRKAYEMIQQRFQTSSKAAELANTSPIELPVWVESHLNEFSKLQKENAKLRRNTAEDAFNEELENIPLVSDVPVLTLTLPGADMDTLRQMADRFRQKHASGVAVLAGLLDDKPQLISVVTDDLVKRGLHAGELVKFVAEPLGGSGGGRPTMAQAGGKDAANLDSALKSVSKWVEKNLKSGK